MRENKEQKCRPSRQVIVFGAYCYAVTEGSSETKSMYGRLRPLWLCDANQKDEDDVNVTV